jgi:uncharacterized protein
VTVELEWKQKLVADQVGGRSDSARPILQELDLKIDSLKKRKDGLPIAMKALDDAFTRLQHQVDAKKNAIGEIEKTQRQTQAAMDLNKDRLTRATSKLESVQNSQEFQAANKEIDQLKKLNSSLEEQIKKSKEDIESGNKDLTALDAQYAKVKGERDAQSAVLSGQSGQLDEEIAAFNVERKKYTTTIDSRVLAQYDRVRGARGGVAFVPAVGGRCSGCNMMVPPQLFNEIQRATAIQACPSCHRILFVPAQSKSDES